MSSNPLLVRRGLAAGLLLLLVVGCMGSQLSEQKLIGTWSTTGKSEDGPAKKIKSDNPNANPGQIVLTMSVPAALELKKDGVFTLHYGLSKLDGSWKFDSQEALVEFDTTLVNDKPPKTGKEVKLLGVIDRTEGTMQIFPLDRKGYEEIQKKGDTGPVARTPITAPLRKKDDQPPSSPGT